MQFVIVIAIPFILALLLLILSRYMRASQQGWLLFAAMAALFGVLLAQLPRLAGQTAQVLDIPWIPEIGLAFSLYVDGLALLFALLITGIGALVMLYAGYYFDDARQLGRFQALLLAFTGSMLALVMAGNVLTLFIAWELTSIISFLLISFKSSDAEARSGASQALMVTGGGGLALLFGLLLMGTATGSMSLGEILSSGDLLREHPWYAAIVILILLGAFTKSAQFPFHFWLPGAMAAPTPASAFLHSATMVKAGIYLLARFYPVLGDTPLWSQSLLVVGLATMLLAAFLALGQRDLKGILAYTTISQLGAFTALLGLREAAGLQAAIIGLLAHALYKGALFLIAGIIDHATGTRNIDELGGLRRQMPLLAAITAVVGLSMAGVPPLFGFVAKEALLEASLAQPLVLTVVAVSAALTVTAALRLFWDVFMGEPPISFPQEEHANHDVHHPLGDDAYDYSPYHAVPILMGASPGLLALLSVVLGVGIAPLLTPLVAAAMGAPVELHLLPPGGVNLPLLISVLALLAGTGLFAVRHVWLSWSGPGVISGAAFYRATVRAIEWAGDLILKTQTGSVRYYLVAILSAVVLLLATVVTERTRSLQFAVSFEFGGITDVLRALLLAIALAATLASVLFKRHLIALLVLSISGYAIGGIFLLEPAPDVALVQFLVETLVTVLVVMLLARTSEEERRKAMERLWDQTRVGKTRDILISVAIGLAVTIFALVAVSSRTPTTDAVAAWYMENALPLTGANDVVAGILTDFRGTDTLIEISVLSMAALGVLTILARPRSGRVVPLFRRRTNPDAEAAQVEAHQKDAQREERRPSGLRFRSPITDMVIIIVLPVALLIAPAHIFYGGVGPGDGFTAGVLAGLGIALWYIVLGYRDTKRRLRWLHPVPLISVGLLVALGNAALPLLFGRDFLSLTILSGFSFAGIKLTSSLLFEVGIFLTVFGSASAIMEAITHPLEVEPL